MPDNIFERSYKSASSTGSGQQIHKKAVFFDADGTICDIENVIRHKIPPQALQSRRYLSHRQSHKENA